MTYPLVTVLMPVYNSEAFVARAIDSILQQTYTRFEFLIVNDGSTDKTKQILQKYAKQDVRIKLVTHHKNQGIVAALNDGLKHAKGKYICRMDADDYAYPERISYQVEYMEEHQSVGVCGAWTKIIGTKTYEWHPPTKYEEIKTKLFVESVIAHPTACLRRATLRKYGMQYDRDFQYVEDYKLWVDLSRVTEIVNLPEVLLEYRSHTGQTSVKKAAEQQQNVSKLKAMLLREIKPDITDSEITLHTVAMSYRHVSSQKALRELRSWYLTLIAENHAKKIYAEDIFARLLAERWAAMCYLAKEVKGKRYFYMFSVPIFIIPAVSYVAKTRLYSMMKYLEATYHRFMT